MANVWNIVEIDTRKELVKVYPRKYFIDEGDSANYILASFNKWTDKTPEQVTIIESPLTKGIFFHANYCEEQDAIEIHYITSDDFNSDIVLDIENHEKCIVKCTKVIFIRHYSKPTEEELKKSKCINEPINQPERKKGSILVGNP